MTEDELKSYLKKHLRLAVKSQFDPYYRDDASKVTYTINIMLDDEPIGESQEIEVIEKD